MKILFQNILVQKTKVYAPVGNGRRPSSVEVHAERCRFDGMQSDTVIVDTPSFFTSHKPDGQDVLKTWMDANYAKPCKAVAVLYMHNLLFNGDDANLKVSKHLDAFRNICRPGLIPSVIHVVPTLSYWADLSEEKMKTLVTHLHRQVYGEGVQFCSTSSGGRPFDGQPETAWDVVQGLFSACGIGPKVSHDHTGKAKVAGNDESL
ncbi:hypothetical protein M404DRAFT_737852 [Pisolithus tinctorius Marx 270]|uniref:Uncharacterized protein n=1 Tax=Pisolithus tinctorius Marx 270 TaxID=870435 RepID=A0A0C3IVY2_PISTI|nr:hypothetical protein M404DRAFT_737852 [Pisolithus tinctorius Marx 270]